MVSGDAMWFICRTDGPMVLCSSFVRPFDRWFLVMRYDLFAEPMDRWSYVVHSSDRSTNGYVLYTSFPGLIRWAWKL